MSVSSVRGKEFYEAVNSGYGKNHKAQERKEDGFCGSLMGEEKTEAQEAALNQVSLQEGLTSGKTAAELFLQGLMRMNAVAVTECEVRRISYEESDCVKICTADGFTLKAKADLVARMVYVEQKNEDGTYQAYEVNPLNVTEDAKSPVTQIAMEAWTKVREDQGEDAETEDSESTLSLFETRLAEFQEYVKERIKEGPPKIQTGGAEFSEEEWEKLIRKIDMDIDAYKEELRERIRRQKEASALKKTEKGVTDTAENAAEAVGDAAGEASGTARPADGIQEEKAGQNLLITENEALEGIENQAPRGSSLLARILGTKKAPYSYLADETGTIVYKGVTFVCDYQKNQICLGNMDNPKNVINIPLAKGGCLRVNRDNIGDLAKAISMFSAEDIGRIMRAVAQDNKAKQVEWELEAEASEGGVEV